MLNDQKWICRSFSILFFCFDHKSCHLCVLAKKSFTSVATLCELNFNNEEIFVSDFDCRLLSCNPVIELRSECLWFVNMNVPKNMIQWREVEVTIWSNAYVTLSSLWAQKIVCNLWHERYYKFVGLHPQIMS